MSIPSTIFYILVFWLSIYLVTKLFFRKQSNVIANPMYILIKKKINEKFLKKVENKKSMKVIALVSIVLTFISMVMFYYLVVPISLVRFSRGESQGGLTPIIPGVTISGESLIYLLVNIGIAATIHEFAHAIVARASGVRIRSVGFILAVIIPMAFVEPEEDDFKKASLKSKVSIYSAGPAFNLVMALVFLFLVISVSSLGSGVLITSVEPNSPADRAGIEAGFIIKRVNDTTVNNINDFQEVLGDYKEKDITFVMEGIKNDGTTFEVIVHKLSNESMLGIGISNALPKGPLGKMLYPIMMFLSWGYIVNFSLAILNAAPIFITDGGRILNDLLYDKVKGDKAKVVNFFVQVFTLLVLLFSLSLRPIG